MDGIDLFIVKEMAVEGTGQFEAKEATMAGIDHVTVKGMAVVVQDSLKPRRQL